MASDLKVEEVEAHLQRGSGIGDTSNGIRILDT